MLVHTTAGHFKFWGCEVSGARGPGSVGHRARFVWGRIGIPQASAQITEKAFWGEGEAINYAQSKKQEKQAKGYRELCFGPEELCFEALARAIRNGGLAPGQLWEFAPYDCSSLQERSGRTMTNPASSLSVVLEDMGSTTSNHLYVSMGGERTAKGKGRKETGRKPANGGKPKTDPEESKVIPGRPKRRIDL
jgi:predicted DNA-binding WGR domain protein